MSEKQRIARYALGFSVLAIVTLVAFVAGGFGLGGIPEKFQGNAEIALPILIMLGAVGLFLALTFVASAFAALNLTDKSKALALPEGSVRSLIALLLISLFAISGIFLFRQLHVPPIHTTSGLTEAEKDEIVTRIPSEDLISVTSYFSEEAGKDLYEIERVLSAGEGSKDFAEQMLTTISTLVVAVSGFYFGSRAVAVAKGVPDIPEPVIRSIEPAAAKQGEEFVAKILGKNFSTPTVKLVRGTIEVYGEDLISSDTTISCTFKLSQDAPTDKKWDLVVINEDKAEDRYVEVFEVTSK